MGTETGTALGGALAWFKEKLGGAKEVKPHKDGSFHMWWQQEPGKFKPGIGMQVAVDSLVFIIEDKIEAPEFTVVARIREKDIPINVRVTATDEVPNKGTTWHRYGVTFLGIAADNWDLIYRYVNDIPEGEDKRAGEEFKPDDAYRMLPLVVQEKIITLLVSERKLDDPKPGQSPLLKLFYSGERHRSDGSVQHFFSIHSRTMLDDEMVAFDTRIVVDGKGDVALQD